MAGIAAAAATGQVIPTQVAVDHDGAPMNVLWQA